MVALAILARFNQFFKRHKQVMVELTKYLDAKRILFLKAKSRDETIKELITAAYADKSIADEKSFSDAVFKREGIVSTGIGMGVAIPHAKLDQCRDFFIVIGIQRGEGIEWKALDQQPVKLIVLIGGPEDRQEDYLAILSQLTTRLKEIAFRRALLAAHAAQEVIELFKSEDHGS